VASWIATRIFYAVVFFMLGAWVASVSPGFKGIMRHATETARQGFDGMRDFTSGTLRAPDPEAKPPARPPPSAPTASELLVRARDAYSRKDLLGAVNAYRAYIDRNPDATDARGELGNVYFAAGRLRDAAEMYFEVATRHLASGDIAGARALRGAVRKGDAPLGDELDRRIAAASGSVK
jgi:hypothetical protein